MNYAKLYQQYKSQFWNKEFEDNFLFTLKGLKNWTTLDWLLVQNQEIIPDDEELFDYIFKSLENDIPPQYLIGKADFFNLELIVDQRVLIPRVETEELVSLILSENDEKFSQVLDIGTGSGAIALALKSQRVDWSIDACDISSLALEVAKSNAINNHLDISFIESNVYENINRRYDIIVSNPPYIAKTDVNEVASNVLKSEPHLALFADESGYEIYRKIIVDAKDYLKPKGKLYFEIGYKQGETVKRFLSESFPKSNIRVIKDQFKKDRMVVMTND